MSGRGAGSRLSQSTAITRAIADHDSEYFNTRNGHYKPRTPTEATHSEASHRGWVARRICPVSVVLLGRVGLVYGWSMPPPSGEQWGDEYGMPHNMYDVCPYAMIVIVIVTVTVTVKSNSNSNSNSHSNSNSNSNMVLLPLCSIFLTQAGIAPRVPVLTLEHC